MEEIERIEELFGGCPHLTSKELRASALRLKALADSREIDIITCEENVFSSLLEEILSSKRRKHERNL